MPVVDTLRSLGLYSDVLDAPIAPRVETPQAAGDSEYFQPGDKIHAVGDLFDNAGRVLMCHGEKAVVIQVVPDGHQRLLYAARCSPSQASDREWRRFALVPGAEAALDMVCLVWPCMIAKVPHMEGGDSFHFRELREDREYSAVSAGFECSGGCKAESAPEGICKFTGRHCPRISGEPMTRFATAFLNWVETINTETTNDVYSIG